MSECRAHAHYPILPLTGWPEKGYREKMPFQLFFLNNNGQVVGIWRPMEMEVQRPRSRLRASQEKIHHQELLHPANLW